MKNKDTFNTMPKATRSCNIYLSSSKKASKGKVLPESTWQYKSHRRTSMHWNRKKKKNRLRKTRTEVKEYKCLGRSTIMLKNYSIDGSSVSRNYTICWEQLTFRGFWQNKKNLHCILCQPNIWIQRRHPVGINWKLLL